MSTSSMGMDNAEWRRTRRWVGWAFIGLFVLVVAAITASLVYFVLRGPTSPGAFFFPFPWFWGIFWVFFIFWIARWFLWPWGWGWGWGGYRRWGYGGRGDEAYHILRERYARGEITKDQFDQMTRDLREHS